MRFHSKIGLVGFLYLIPAAIYVCLRVMESQHRMQIGHVPAAWNGIIGLLFALTSVIWSCQWIFIYWDFDASGVRERRLWRTTTVPWNEVTYIGPWASATLKCIAIEYEKAPLSRSKRMVAAPIRRKAFIAAIRQFAPHAKFEP